VRLITSPSRARLVAHVLGVEAESNDLQWLELWRDDSHVSLSPLPHVETVVSYFAPNHSWRSNAARVFPNATIYTPEGPLDRVTSLALAATLGGSPPDMPPVAPIPVTPLIVAHVGAGGRGKCWSIPRWIECAARAPEHGIPRVQLIAGEVELETWGQESLAAFHEAGGKCCPDLDDLCRCLGLASFFVGADSGPGHLAAQLGVPTLTLFGPTDPARWAPIGPRVRAVAPPAPAPMDWLVVERVLNEVRAMMPPPSKDHA
jgi:ADP-heptose:LPS heptosyltransferase